jgi:hydrogenase nickel incorporation protein HypA/HybF
MHELSVTQEMLGIALDKAKEVGAKKINRINLVIGEMSGIIDDSVQFYFDFLSEDTVAHKAELSFRRVPTKVKCRNCGHTYSPDSTPWNCPECSQWNAEVIAGREFYIENMEVDE